MGNDEFDDEPGAQQERQKNAATEGHIFKQPVRSFLHKLYDYALQQWFIIALGIAIGIAAAIPRLGATGGYIRAEYSIKYPAIIIIFLISGIGLKTKALVTATADLRIHLLVQSISLAAIPTLGYAIALGLRRNGFDSRLADGIVIMASMPTTVSTNVVYTERAAGNEAAALVNAVIGNIIGIFITPLWLGLFLEVSGAAPYVDVLTELAYTIIAPLVVGQLLQYFVPKAVSWIKAHVNMSNVSSFCIVLLVWVTFCNTFANGSTRQVPGGEVAAIVFLDIALFSLFVVISFVIAWPPPPFRVLRRVLRLSKPDVVAVVICGSTKTVALGVPLINVMYQRVPYAGLLAMPLIIYHALQVVLGGIMLSTLKKWCLKADTYGNGRCGGDAAALGSASSTTWQQRSRAWLLGSTTKQPSTSAGDSGASTPTAATADAPAAAAAAADNPTATEAAAGPGQPGDAVVVTLPAGAVQQGEGNSQWTHST